MVTAGQDLPRLSWHRLTVPIWGASMAMLHLGKGYVKIK